MFFLSRNQKEQIEALQTELAQIKEQLEETQLQLQREKETLEQVSKEQKEQCAYGFQKIAKNVEMIHLYAMLSEELAESEQLKENQKIIRTLCEEMMEQSNKNWE